MPYLIDAHEDMAWNWLTFQTDYSQSISAIRAAEAGDIEQRRGGKTLLGWSEYSSGQTAIVFGTYFIAPGKYSEGDWDRVVFDTPMEYSKLINKSIDYYQMLAEKYPDKFRTIYNKKELAETLGLWQKFQNNTDTDKTPPMGIVNLIEGAEGLGSFDELETWWQNGARILGPVWAGTRFCGGTMEGKGFTHEGRKLLSAMSEIGYVLDVSHMNDESIATSVNEYQGTVIATHANCRWLLKNPTNQRHLSRENVQRLVERNAVIGVIPYAKFLRTDWDTSHPASLEDLANHIDAICQIAGNADHVAIGTDFDGGFGWPNVPEEINSIADMQKLTPILHNRGYTSQQVEAVFHDNWERILNQSLPES